MVQPYGSIAIEDQTPPARKKFVVKKKKVVAMRPAEMVVALRQGADVVALSQRLRAEQPSQLQL